MVQSLEYQDDNMCQTFAPYGRLTRRPGPFMASCLWHLFVFVFLVAGISPPDHMVGWVQLWSLVPFSFKTAPPLRLQRCKNTPAAKNTMGSQQCRMDCCKLHKLKR